jgi:hypothetical protein
VINNIFWQNGETIAGSAGGTVSNNLTTQNPLFVNEPLRDFRLSANSPAIDAGTTLPSVPTDFEGTLRPQGGAYDIGADEYGAGTQQTPTPTPTGTPCTQYTPSSQIPPGFGVPWDVTNPSIMLVSAQCTPPTLLLKAGNPNTTGTLYVYKDGSPEPYCWEERVRGESAWRPDGSCMAGWRGDVPLTENWDPRAWLLVPVGATPVPLGWAVGVVCGVTSYGRHAL